MRSGMMRLSKRTAYAVAYCCIIYILNAAIFTDMINQWLAPNRFRTISLDKLEKVAGLDRAIFFLETNEGLEEFPIQSECAFESAALRNPSRPVIVLASLSSRMTEYGIHLAGKSNLHFFKIDFRSLTSGTVLQVRENSLPSILI